MCIQAREYDFKVNGIAYRITNTDNMEVAVANDCEEPIVEIYNEPSMPPVPTEYNSTSYEGDIVIPSEINYEGVLFKVTSIDPGAFNGSNITSITLPQSIQSIGEAAFKYCSKLKTFTWPNNISILPPFVLYYSGVENLILPEGVTELNEGAIGELYHLKNLQLPSTLKIIGGDSYPEIKERNYSLPEGIEYLYGSSYPDRPGLHSDIMELLTIPSSVKGIGNSALYGISTLRVVVSKSIIMSKNSSPFISNTWSAYGFDNSYNSDPDYLLVPKGYTHIYRNWTTNDIIEFDNISDFTDIGTIFKDDNLEYVIIGNGDNKKVFAKNLENSTEVRIPLNTTYNGSTYRVSGISKSLGENKNVKNLYVNSPEPFSITSDFFNTITYLTCTLHVPHGCKEAYANATGWSKFKNIVEDGILTISASAGQGGSVSVDKTQVEEGGNVTFTITPNDDYAIDKVTLNNEDVTSQVANGKLTIENVKTSLALNATFKFVATAATIKMSNKYMTYCNTRTLDFSNQTAISAYIAVGYDEGRITLAKVTKVPAGTGVLLKGTPGTYKVNYTTKAPYYTNLFKGVTSATTINPTEGNYTNFILANDPEDGIGFYKVSTSGELAAGKAYLQIPNYAVSSMAKGFSLFFEDETTGIKQIDEKNANTEVYYNLQGVKVNKPTQKGIYIINGKKYIKK